LNHPNNYLKHLNADGVKSHSETENLACLEKREKIKNILFKSDRIFTLFSRQAKFSVSSSEISLHEI